MSMQYACLLNMHVYISTAMASKEKGKIFPYRLCVEALLQSHECVTSKNGGGKKIMHLKGILPSSLSTDPGLCVEEELRISPLQSK